MASQTSVIPLLMSNISWANFIKDVADLTSRSPTSSIDNSNLKLSDYARYLVTLGEFQSGKQQAPLDILRNNDHLLRCLFFGFLINGSSSLIFRIMELTDLDVLTAKGADKSRIAVVNGSLKQWKDAIIICLSQKLIKNYELRYVFNECLNCFYAAGLRNIFDNYRKKGLEDQTYLLEYKG